MIRTVWKTAKYKVLSVAIAVIVFAFLSICSMDDSSGSVGGGLDYENLLYMIVLALLFAYALLREDKLHR